MSAPPEISSQTVFFPSSASRLWSTYAGTTVSPTRISPRSGFSCPRIMRTNVVLPAPFGPTTPTIAPRGIERERSSISTRSP